MMKEDDPVFIVGFNRSGTTALVNTIGRHSGFSSVLEGNPETRVFTNPMKMFWKPGEGGQGIFDYLGNKETHFKSFQELIGKKRHWHKKSLLDLLRAYFFCAKKNRQSRRLLEKTPNHVLKMHLIMSCFPQAKIIMNCRHPLDVYSSLRKKRMKRESSGPPKTKKSKWQNFSPEDFAELYITISKEIMLFRKEHTDNCYFQEYEELTNNPLSSLDKIGQFIGEPFDLDLLYHQTAKADFEGEVTENSALSRNPKKWSDYICIDEARRIEDYLGTYLEPLGYRRYT